MPIWHQRYLDAQHTVLPKPQSPEQKAIKSVLIIVSVAHLVRIVLMMTGMPVIWDGNSLSTPAYTNTRYYMPDDLFVVLLNVLISAVFAEIVWQCWTRRISRPNDILFTRPLRYHIIAIAVACGLVCVPSLIRSLAEMFGH